MRRRANQSTNNGPDCGSSECDPPGIALVMDVVNDVMPRRRRRRTMRTMPPVPRRGNRRASRQNHPSHENRECLDDLVHITPTFPDFLSLHQARKPHRRNLTKTFAAALSRPYPTLIVPILVGRGVLTAPQSRSNESFVFKRLRGATHNRFSRTPKPPTAALF